MVITRILGTQRRLRWNRNKIIHNLPPITMVQSERVTEFVCNNVLPIIRAGIWKYVREASKIA